jgi:hypothetical protein
MAMQSVEYTLAVDHRGWARIQMQPPYSLFGGFLSSIISPARMRDLRSLLAAYRADSTWYAYYSHDYHELEFEPSDGFAWIVIDHPDELRKCEMPMAEFVQLAERWLAFAEAHPVTFPNNRPSVHYPAED